jgi:hypothetical protein
MNEPVIAPCLNDAWTPEVAGLTMLQSRTASDLDHQVRERKTLAPRLERSQRAVNFAVGIRIALRSDMYKLYVTRWAWWCGGNG